MPRGAKTQMALEIIPRSPTHPDKYFNRFSGVANDVKKRSRPFPEPLAAEGGLSTRNFATGSRNLSPGARSGIPEVQARVT